MSEYDANRQLSTSKHGAVAPIKPAKKKWSLTVKSVLMWMAYAVLVAITSSLFRNAI